MHCISHTVHGLYRILITATSVMGVRKMENIVPTAGIEPTSLAFQARVLPLHHICSPDVTTIPTAMQFLASEVSADMYIALALRKKERKTVCFIQGCL